MSYPSPTPAMYSMQRYPYPQGTNMSAWQQVMTSQFQVQPHVMMSQDRTPGFHPGLGMPPHFAGHYAPVYMRPDLYSTPSGYYQHSAPTISGLNPNEPVFPTHPLQAHVDAVRNGTSPTIPTIMAHPHHSLAGNTPSNLTQTSGSEKDDAEQGGISPNTATTTDPTNFSVHGDQATGGSPHQPAVEQEVSENVSPHPTNLAESSGVDVELGSPDDHQSVVAQWLDDLDFLMNIPDAENRGTALPLQSTPYKGVDDDNSPRDSPVQTDGPLDVESSSDAESTCDANVAVPRTDPPSVVSDQLDFPQSLPHNQASTVPEEVGPPSQIGAKDIGCVERTWTSPDHDHVIVAQRRFVSSLPQQPPPPPPVAVSAGAVSPCVSVTPSVDSLSSSSSPPDGYSMLSSSSGVFSQSDWDSASPRPVSPSLSFFGDDSDGDAASSPLSSDTSAAASDRSGKPEESYVAMIAKAILSSPENRMMLSDIYDHLSKTSTYCATTKAPWRNAVRHNLSVNECFIKSGAVTNGKRGYYWAIHPACADEFRRGRFNRTEAKRRIQQAQRAAMASINLNMPTGNENGSYQFGVYGDKHSSHHGPDRNSMRPGRTAPYSMGHSASAFRRVPRSEEELPPKNVVLVPGKGLVSYSHSRPLRPLRNTDVEPYTFPPLPAYHNMEYIKRSSTTVRIPRTDTNKD